MNHCGLQAFFKYPVVRPRDGIKIVLPPDVSLARRKTAHPELFVKQARDRP